MCVPSCSPILCTYQVAKCEDQNLRTGLLLPAAVLNMLKQHTRAGTEHEAGQPFVLAGDEERSLSPFASFSVGCPISFDRRF
jgi:hypothetical protein